MPDHSSNSHEAGAASGRSDATPDGLAPDNPNLALALRYFAAVERGAVGPDLAAFFDPAISAREHPNRLVPAGVTRDLPALLEAADKGQRVVADQRYEVRSIIASGDTVAAEVLWSATLRIPLGLLPVGGSLRAAFAVFLTFRGGKIVSQRNYDCFDPF